MTDKKGTPGKDQSKPGEKRPHATLDLKATEVAGKTSAKTAIGKSSADASATKSGTKPSSSTTSGAKTTEKQAAAGKSDTSTAAKPDGNVAPKKSGGSFLSHMAAGIVGAALTLIGANTFLQQGEKSPPIDTTAIEQRLAALEQTSTDSASVATIPQDLETKLAAAQERLAILDQISAELESIKSQQTTLSAQTADLDKKISSNDAPASATSRLETLEQQLKTLSAAANTGDGTGSSIPQLAAITGRLADLERTLANQMTALRDGVAQDVEKRISTTAEASVAAQSGMERMDRELSIVKTDTARFGQQLEALKADAKNVNQKLRIVQEETGTLSSNVNNLKDELVAQFGKTAKPADIVTAVASVSEKISALEGKVNGVVATEEARSENAKRIVLSLELANLKRALARGQSYTAELESVRAAAPASFDLATLDKYKNDGVPTLPKLQSDFRSLAHKIIDAETVPVDGSIVDRLLAGAKSVVRVRKINHSADDTSVEATVARMGTALEDGELSLVIEEAKKLPATAATPAQDWLEQAEALAQVNMTIAKIDEQLKQSLGGTETSSKPSETPAKQD